MQMENRENDNIEAINPVENALREFLHNCPSHVPVDDLPLVRVVCDPVEDVPYLGDQISPESRTLLLVPPRGSAQVQLCLSSDNKTVGHRSPRMSFFTFAQVSTSSGFCSCC